jgi:hypothetical protein
MAYSVQSFWNVESLVMGMAKLIAESLWCNWLFRTTALLAPAAAILWFGPDKTTNALLLLAYLVGGTAQLLVFLARNLRNMRIRDML